MKSILLKYKNIKLCPSDFDNKLNNLNDNSRNTDTLPLTGMSAADLT